MTKSLLLAVLTILAFLTGYSQKSYTYIDPQTCDIIPGIPIVLRSYCEVVRNEMKACNWYKLWGAMSEGKFPKTELSSRWQLILKGTGEWVNKCNEQARY